MAKVDVLNWEKEAVDQVELNSLIFQSPVRKDILHEVVKWQLAGRRQGTHKVKTRGEVSGGGKKPFKQKGTGNARQGSNRSPLMPGGAVLFGPKPRDYSYTLPKKVRQLGLRSALSFLFQEGRLLIVDQMKSEDGKTKTLAQSLKKFGLNRSVLISSNRDDLFKRAAKNLPHVVYYGPEGLNVFDLLKYDFAVLTRDSVEKIESRCGLRN